MRATIGGHTAIVRLLLERPDVALDAVDQAGMPALFRACVEGHGACVMALLSAGAALQPTADHAKLCSNVIARAERSGHAACVDALKRAVASHARHDESPLPGDALAVPGAHGRQLKSLLAPVVGMCVPAGHGNGVNVPSSAQ